MTLEYRCSNCGTLLQTTNADPLHDEIKQLRELLERALPILAAAAAGAIVTIAATNVYRDMRNMLSIDEQNGNDNG